MTVTPPRSPSTALSHPSSLCCPRARLTPGLRPRAHLPAPNSHAQIAPRCAAATRTPPRSVRPCIRIHAPHRNRRPRPAICDSRCTIQNQKSDAPPAVLRQRRHDTAEPTRPSLTCHGLTNPCEEVRRPRF
ncbi:hypothetical protein B0H15DRAFT_1026805, partial [Mycena belliarum]